MYFLATVGRKAAFLHSLYANACHSPVMNHILNCVLQVFLFLFLLWLFHIIMFWDQRLIIFHCYSICDHTTLFSGTFPFLKKKKKRK